MCIFRIDYLFQIKIFKNKNAWVGFKCMWSICCALLWPNHRHRTTTPTAKTDRVKYCERRSFVQPTDRPMAAVCPRFSPIGFLIEPIFHEIADRAICVYSLFAFSRFMCNSMYINVYKCNAVPCAECRGRFTCTYIVIIRPLSGAAAATGRNRIGVFVCTDRFVFPFSCRTILL